MGIQVSIDPAARRGFLLVLSGILLSVSLVGIASLVERSRPVTPSTDDEPVQHSSFSAEEILLLPVVDLCVSADAPESAWIDAVAMELGGDDEVSVQGGRMDVRTKVFAIEIDRLEKWHEGIGQSLHYAEASGLRPALGLILPDAAAPGDGAEVKLEQVERIAFGQGIRLFLLRRAC